MPWHTKWHTKKRTNEKSLENIGFLFAWRRGVAPASRMKAQQAHMVPLSKQAVALLQHQVGQHEELVFPSIQAHKAL
ncbi:hypothetical protein [Stenotrophomonas sp.]|uniref:hypothetical protein n=1 Tax=Stenotrophomonas sp. TaxID=69392 RepID=UPI0028AFAB00|nr:hypothetical protein [Stenotrophomonas sp.]